MKTAKVLLVSVLIGGAFAAIANGQTVRERFIARMKEKSVAAPADPAATVAGATQKTFSYGSDPAQAIDVYTPPNDGHSPIIVMVHGGGWRIGDKTSRGVIDNKLKHWLPKGFILVSVNYRMLPQSDVDVQARDVAAATAYVQAHAAEWGGDGNKVILMGHSAGAHLVALLSSDPARVTAEGGHAWPGTVVIDSAAYDVPAVMSRKHPKLYDDAFGKDPAYWASLSPAQQLKPDAVPMLLLCALKRPDDSCGQSHAFAARLKTNGQDAPVLEQDLIHMQINDNLGQPGAYTDAVDAFIAERLK